MASVDDFMDAVAVDITAALAPYQPNEPPSFPNNASTAGQIIDTVVGAGAPLQGDVTFRLENNKAQVAIVPMPQEKLQPFLRVNEEFVGPLTGSPASGTAYFTYSRLEKLFDIQVWAPDRESRRAISDLLMAHFSIAYNLDQADGTESKMIYGHHVDEDSKQPHSMYIRHHFYNVDITLTQPSPVTVAHTITDNVTVGLNTSVSLPTLTGSTL